MFKKKNKMLPGILYTRVNNINNNSTIDYNVRM